MQLSVVVPTLNGRNRLGDCLDALSEHAPEAEVIVVNGPSADGTTGMITERSDVDVLVEISERNVNVARNAGLAVASSDAIAVVSYDREIDPSWTGGALENLRAGADVVSGPTRRTLGAGANDEQTIAGSSVPRCNGENLAFRREAIEALDGFDEYLTVGGVRDLSHRIASMDLEFRWTSSMSVHSSYGSDGGAIDPDYRVLYRSLSYQIVKNYGFAPLAVLQTLREAGRDAVGSAGEVIRGDEDASRWLADGRDVCSGLAKGILDGLRARYRDRSSRRNPHGLSTRKDRAVHRYDWR